MTTSIRLDRILELLGDATIRISGPLARWVTHPAPLHEARSPEAITFCREVGDKGRALLHATGAGVILCPEELLPAVPGADGKTLIAVPDPRLSFLRLVQALFAAPMPTGIHPSAVIDPEAQIHPSVYIGPFSYIGKCEIGAGSIIHGHVYLYSNTRIGRNVIIHAGTVIGADGFGYQRNEVDELEKFPHVGGVVIEDGVEIGSNTSIDRGTLGDTVIGEGAKIDNLVHIAHNVVVGRHTAVIAHAMIGGSTRIGAYAWVAPSACVRESLAIGDRAIVGLGALVVKDVAAGATVMGAPARPADEYKALLKVWSRGGE